MMMDTPLPQNPLGLCEGLVALSVCLLCHSVSPILLWSFVWVLLPMSSKFLSLRSACLLLLHNVFHLFSFPSLPDRLVFLVKCPVYLPCEFLVILINTLYLDYSVCLCLKLYICHQVTFPSVSQNNWFRISLCASTSLNPTDPVHERL